MKSISRVIASVAMLLALFHLTCNTARSEEVPLPEYFGIYLVSGSELIELKAHEQSSRVRTSIMGEDLLRSLPGPTVSDGDIQFIVYTSNPVNVMEIFVNKIASVAGQVNVDANGNVTQRQPFKESFWWLSNEAVSFRIAPVPERANMIRAVSRESLEPGIWGLFFGGSLFDFKIGPNPLDSALCVERAVSLTGAQYHPCPMPPPPPLSTAEVVSIVGEEGDFSIFSGFSETFPLEVDELSSLVITLLEDRKVTEENRDVLEIEGGVVIRAALSGRSSWSFGADPYEKVTSNWWESYSVRITRSEDSSSIVEIVVPVYRGHLNEETNRYEPRVDRKSSGDRAGSFLAKLAKRVKKYNKKKAKGG